MPPVKIQYTGGSNIVLVPQAQTLPVVTTPSGGWQSSANATAAQPQTFVLKSLLPGAANYEPFLREVITLFAVLAGSLGAFISARMWSRRALEAATSAREQRSPTEIEAVEVDRGGVSQ